MTEDRVEQLPDDGAGHTMTAILELFADPLFVIAVAILIFAARVVYLARGLKSAAAHPTLADLRALEEAKRSLNAHRESLEAAKEELSANLGSARDTLRRYRAPLARAKEEKGKAIERSIVGLRRYREPYEAVQRARRDALEGAMDQKALRQAKALIERFHPRRTGPKKSPAAAPKDI